ncbi:MAG: SURF1 family protein [Litoreibacter sp.]|nr:SURF1 family protein [Litoreibacter sp.]
MTKRMIVPLIFGCVGCAILISLGTWQVQRLAWKEGILAEIAQEIAAPPVALPAQADPETDRYLPVMLEGDFTGEELHVLFSIKNVGPGYRVIALFNTKDGRRVLVDRGFAFTNEKDLNRSADNVSLIGNLHWPNEIDSFTPEPDIEGNIWFARDLPAMAEELGAEPLLIVARSETPRTPGVSPVPVTPTGIPNDHLQYAITWFLLAIAWAGMTAYLLWRIRQRTV